MIFDFQSYLPKFSLVGFISSPIFAVLAILLFAGTPQAIAAPTLHIFNPSYTKAHTMQKKISAFCPNIEVSVYGKAKDFRKRNQLSPPAAMISLPIVIKQYSEYTLLAKGKKNQSFDQIYYLVAVDKAPTMDTIVGKQIGVIDLLGRKPMTELTKTLLGDVTIKRVGKAEDLLPLLNFKAVDALFISESDLSDLKSTTQLNLQTTKTSIRLGLPITVLLEQKNKSAIQQCIAAFDNSTNNYLSVEKWSVSP
ncbi:MAG: hypothetical protein COA99_06175 [Moraxellaceae bacterium]|nr:MAG: hypothetical protein COA99_06175 [Moraxellaceae bacterium]